MPEKLKEILQKVMDWWNKFTSRQKTIIIGLAASVIFAFAIIIYVTSQPQYTVLRTCESAAEAAEVKELLEAEGINYKPSENGLKFSVEIGQYQAAVWALGSAGYGADEFTLKEALSGGITTTAADKEKLTVEAYQSKFEKNLTYYSNIKSASVLLHIPPDDGTLGRSREESSAYIRLELDGTFTSTNAANIARAVASWLGNDTTANITILDTEANLLFAGGDDYTTAGIASSMQELQNQGQAMVANQVKSVLLGTGQFSNAVISCSLEMDYSSYEETAKRYTVEDGRDEGYLSHEETFENENENTATAFGPGTDSNDETIYQSPDGTNSSSTQTENLRDYLPNENIQNKVTPAGAINYTNSTMSISLVRYREYREEDIRRQGLLDGGITWEEYKLNNAEDVKLEVDEDYYLMAQNATRIPRENISIVYFESPIFVDAPGFSVDSTTVMSIVLLVVILALLAFVVLRSMMSKRRAQEDEELSVENLLQSTPESELEDIDVEAKSDTRRMIEKFVDENPESAALLLRNWLSDEW
ncbi:MAG: flagellar M-ring protein FliF [Clostridium sp.]|nr:flagellar M-ring protein FliF [Acetatifactor muris]MCM1526020.1 flagellar M-ring protein FliF [Bacteroides sp.]MCM1562220.1 flagellar M-ring protein FliF [Clostridium sp.]